MTEKHFFIILLFTTGLLFTPSYGDNLLTNPGFETGTTTGWSGFGCSISAVTVPHSDSYSCRASNRSGTWSGPGQLLTGIINDGETCIISGWIKLENASSSYVKMTVLQTDGSGTSYHFIDSATAYDSNWTNLSGIFTLDVNDTLTQLRLYVEGPDPNINFYLDDASVIVTSSEDWETEANERIEQIRKGDFRITVVSPNDPNVTVPDVNVEIIQKKHHFAFGSMLLWQQIHNTHYLNFFRDHFEWAVMANASKWYHNEPSEGYVTYTDADKMYNFCEKNDIQMRGHCIFWASENMVQSWVKDLSYAPLPATSELRTAVENRMNSAVNHFKNKFLHWDVNNEMCDNSFFADRLGYDIQTWMFQAAHAIDPDCLLFLNDYNVINGGYNTNSFKQIAYYLIAQGTPIHGLGVQCHMTTGFSPATIKARFDSVAEVNLPIWVTEFDVEQSDENIKADELEDFYRVAFSHPSVEGILVWGDTFYMVNPDWSLNAAGERYEDLMDEWTTNDSNITDSSGNTDFRGFYGTYDVILTPAGGDYEVHNIELTNSPRANQFTLQLGTGTQADYNAPVLEPFTWLSPPQAVSHDTVLMSVPQSNDVSGAEYYFNNVTDPNHDSGWLDSTFYADNSLIPNTNYTYRFKIRDKSIKQNETNWSDLTSVTTPGSGGNIIANPGFEAATIIGWTKWTGDLTSVTDKAHSGNYSGYAAIRGKTWQGPVQNITDKVINGKMYECSAWVRLENRASDTVSIIITQVDDSGTRYHVADSGTASNDHWTYLEGNFSLDVNGVLETLNIYISGPAPDVNFYVDDVVVKTEPINCFDVQEFGFAIEPDINGDCYVGMDDLAVIALYWLHTDCAVLDNCENADLEPDGDVDFLDYSDFALDWLNCNNPQDSSCPHNW